MRQKENDTIRYTDIKIFVMSIKNDADNKIIANCKFKCI